MLLEGVGGPLAEGIIPGIPYRRAMGCHGIYAIQG
jgi:hypothetical protein